MKFELKVNLDDLTGDKSDELGRILRYWGGAAKQLDLTQPQQQEIYDSSYAAPVGFWQLS